MAQKLGEPAVPSRIHGAAFGRVAGNWPGQEILVAVPLTTMPPVGGISTLSRLGRPMCEPWCTSTSQGAVTDSMARR